MTRKDYVLIADAVSTGKIDENSTSYEAGYTEAANRAIIKAIATALATDNPNFNRATFLAACDV